MGTMAIKSAPDWGGNTQGCGSRRCYPHSRHCSSRVSALHLAGWTQAAGSLWTSWIRKNYDVILGIASFAWPGGTFNKLNNRKVTWCVLLSLRYFVDRRFYYQIGSGIEFLECDNSRADVEDIWPLLWIQKDTKRRGFITNSTEQVACFVLRWDQFAWHGQIWYLVSHFLLY